VSLNSFIALCMKSWTWVGVGASTEHVLVLLLLLLALFFWRKDSSVQIIVFKTFQILLEVRSVA